MYDAEYIRELTAARKANEVARNLIQDHERTIIAQRAGLDRARRWSVAWKRRANELRDTAQALQDRLDAAERHAAELAAALAVWEEGRGGMITINPSQAQPGDVLTTPQFGAQTIAQVDAWPSGIVRIVFATGLVLNTPDDVPLTVRRVKQH